MKNIPVLFLFFLLMACAPAVAAPPAPTETPAPTNTPVPTATIIPSPTPTATPVAVNGIATDAEGNLLAYLNGEWVTLPKLDADHASMRISEKGVVEALNERGMVKYEYRLSSGEWEKVGPDVVMNTSNFEKYNQFRDRWLSENPWALEPIEWDSFVTDRMKDKEGNDLGFGVLSEWRADDGEMYVVYVGAVALGGYEYNRQEGGSTIYVGVFGVPVDDQGTVLVFATGSSGNRPAYNVWLYREGVWKGRTSTMGLTADQLMQVVFSPEIRGKQVVVRIQVYNTGFPEYNAPNEEFIEYIKGERDAVFSGPQDLGMNGFEAPEDWALRLAGLRK